VHAKFLVCHFPAAKLQLDPDFISSIEEFFAVTDLCQIIVVVDINAKLEFFQLRACRSLVPLMLGNIVSEFSESDDFANWRVRGGRNLDQIKAHALGFAQGIRQFHDAELFA
jgi:hypothetical protein